MFLSSYFITVLIPYDIVRENLYPCPRAKHLPLPFPGAPDPRFTQARQELHQLGYFLKGTVLKRMMKCGQPNCACHRDPSQRHGPYFEWTYKVQIGRASCRERV